MPEPIALQKGSDAEILSRAKVTITLAGRDYVWTEVGRRQARQMLQEILPIMTLAGEGQSDPSKALQAIDDTLDFCYRYHPGMRKDRQVLDNDASNEDIAAALQKIMEVVDAPFRRDRKAREQPDEVTNLIPTPNPESTS